MEQNRTTAVRKERVLLVGVLPQDTPDHTEMVDEIGALAESAGAIVVDSLVQRRDRPDPSTYIGKGKLEELSQLCVETKADTVVFDVDLSPAQVRNIEKCLDRKVIDRTELILDIFAARARTREARLEVELAQLEYTFPRLRRMWTHLDTVAGGMMGGIGGGIGTRGPGERQIETDRRLVRRRIRDLKRQLDVIGARRRRLVASRRDEATACLVGYTNAGKSTLMNALTSAGVYVADKLFATLDTRTRVCELGDHSRLLLSDTVGFIRRLPHHLVASFRATLEEARQADVLLHVVDASAPDAEEQIEAVREVLADLELSDRPEILVLNKIDQALDPDRLVRLRQEHTRHVCVSAATGEGLDALRARIRDFVRSGSVRLEVRFSPANGKLQSYLEEHAQVIDRDYSPEEVVFAASVSRQRLEQIRRLGGEIVSDDPAAAATREDE